jgi:hypothetical protein
MRLVHRFGAIVVLCAACLAITAGVAQAANKLVLSSSGTALKNGGKAFSELKIATCLQFTEGHLAENAKPTDKLTFTKIASSSCEPGWASTGHIEKISLNSKGAATYSADYELTVPGGCVYSFKHFKGHFEIPGFTVVTGEEVGKLNKKASTPGCEKTLQELFEADIDIASFGAPLEKSFLA